MVWDSVYVKKNTNGRILFIYLFKIAGQQTTSARSEVKEFSLGRGPVCLKLHAGQLQFPVQDNPNCGAENPEEALSVLEPC